VAFNAFIRKCRKEENGFSFFVENFRWRNIKTEESESKKTISKILCLTFASFAPLREILFVSRLRSKARKESAESF
jgi:hypothetical protein